MKENKEVEQEEELKPVSLVKLKRNAIRNDKTGKKKAIKRRNRAKNRTARKSRVTNMARGKVAGRQ